MTTNLSPKQNRRVAAGIKALNHRAAILRGMGVPVSLEVGFSFLDQVSGFDDPNLAPVRLEGHDWGYWIGGQNEFMDAQVAANNARIGTKLVGNFVYAQIFRTGENGRPEPVGEPNENILVWLGYPGEVSAATHDVERFLEAAEQQYAERDRIDWERPSAVPHG
ncbi:MAG: hypothetical protein AAGA95_10575 [Pseudomonadota bacterium]